MKDRFGLLVERYLELNNGCALVNANKKQIFEAMATASNTILAEKRSKFMKKVNKDEEKQVFYMSMEFLVGRSLKNNLYNLGIVDNAKTLLKDISIDLDDIYELEPDAGLGNGGLGRLASCYLDSLSTLGYPATGFSIRYDFGIFKQVISDGWQMEFPDNWLEMGGYWLNPRRDEAVEVKFYGHTKENWEDDGLHITHENYTTIVATPYDLLISGYNSEAVNTLRLWSAKSKNSFDMGLFSKGEYAKSTEEAAIASSISKVLYPADDTDLGKELRIKQQYFFVSASLQQIVSRHMGKYGTLDNLHEKVAIHINDTHPSLCIPELMRLLVDEHRYSWEQAWDITTKTVFYTNHTVMSEALEKWRIELFQPILPRIYMIIEEINKRFCNELFELHQGQSIANMAIIMEGYVRMANLCMVGAKKVNGVSALHSNILKEDTFKDFNRIYPEKLTNVTNGIAYRRWLVQSNGELSSLLNQLIGDDYLKDLKAIKKLKDFKDDQAVIDALFKIKKNNKLRLGEHIKHSNGVNIDPDSIFDVQVKRLHEYKRQLLNALYILHLYQKIKNDGYTMTPRTFIFAAKASAGYFMAKEIIRFIHAIAQMIEHDPYVRQFITVVFVADYKVSLAEIIIPSADISQQISLAGKEASGTGNMKLMINGAVTLGTMDGANVEIYEAVGAENIFIFGMNANEVNDLRNHYNPKSIYENDYRIKNLIDFIAQNKVNGKNFDSIVSYLVNEDPYMNLADFDSYANAQEKVEYTYKKKDIFGKMMLENIAGSSIFSSDRAIMEYVNNIWKL